MNYLSTIEQMDTSKMDLLDAEEVTKTIYIRPKDWCENYDPDNPRKLIGIYRNTFFKEFKGKERANHVIIGPKSQEFVLNSCADLDAKMQKVPSGSCVCIYFSGMKENPMDEGKPSYCFSVARLRKFDLTSEQTIAMLQELKQQDAKFQKLDIQKPIAMTVTNKKDLPF